MERKEDYSESKGNMRSLSDSADSDPEIGKLGKYAQGWNGSHSGSDADLRLCRRTKKNLRQSEAKIEADGAA